MSKHKSGGSRKAILDLNAVGRRHASKTPATTPTTSPATPPTTAAPASRAMAQPPATAAAPAALATSSTLPAHPSHPAAQAGPPPVISLKDWPDDQPTRWVIDYSLTTQGLLHLGSGEDVPLSAEKAQADDATAGAAAPAAAGPANDPADDDDPFAAAMWQADRDGTLHAWMPGSSLKGALAARARACADLDAGSHTRLFDRLFGRVGDEKEIDDANPLATEAGSAEFGGATGPAAPPPPTPRPDGTAPPADAAAERHLPFEIETRTAIDRVMLTVAEGKLYQEQVLPPGSAFTARIVLPKARKAEAQTLCALLQGIDASSPLTLGAHGRAGWGRVTLTSLKLRAFGPAQARLWWNQPASEVKTRRGWETYAVECTPAGTPIRPSAPALQLPLTLHFDGPFAVRDPRYKKRNAGDKDSQPRARAGRPLLPATSLVGALRSQAERILRTLSATAVPQGHAAPAVRTDEQPQDLASLLFGCAGWRGLVGTEGDFIGEAGSPRMTQQMVALCRITGTAGGLAGAKFAFECWQSPSVAGVLTFDRKRFLTVLEPARRQAALGLLHLVLTDLSFGDIGFGMARSKGWGWVKEDTKLLNRVTDAWWTPLAQEAQNGAGPADEIVSGLLKALHAQPGFALPADFEPPSAEGGGGSAAQTAGPGGPSLPTLQRGPGKRGVGDEFHNPYHFLPFAKLHGAPPKDAAAPTPSVADAAEQGRHRHDRFEAGKFSGRLQVFLTTKTPLFIGAERGEAAENTPTPVAAFTYLGQRAIPGTSLRGMLGALIEPMSGSAMRFVDSKRLLSMRLKLNGENLLPTRGVVVKVRFVATNQEVLQIKYLPEAETQMKYLPIPERPSALLYALADDRWRAVGKDLDLSTEEKRDALADRLYCPYPRVDAKGKPNGTAKGKVDLLPAIDVEGRNAFTWPRNDDEKTLGSRARLRPNQIVYFRLEKDAPKPGAKRQITEIAWSQVYRKTVWVDPVPGGQPGGPLTVGRLVERENPNRLPLGQRPDFRLHAAEWMLGVVESREQGASALAAHAFASKLSFGLGEAVTALKPAAEVVLKELSTPKPPSPALYLRKLRSRQAPISKDDMLRTPDAHGFHGTKTYLHALRAGPAGVAPLDAFGRVDSKTARAPWISHRQKTAPGTSDEDKDFKLSDRQVTIQPIGVDERFKFTIRFTNLSVDELALLCAALQPSQGFEHRLGMGRPIGLGSVKLSFDRLTVIDRARRLTDGSAAHVPLDPVALAAQGMAALEKNDGRLRAALLALGEPDRVRHPVHYPQVAPGTRTFDKRGRELPPMKGRIENLNYQWWMKNDEQEGNDRQMLTPLDELPPTPPSPPRKSR